MLDKDPALNLLIRTADLELDLSENCLKLVDKVEVINNYVKVSSHSVFYLRTNPPKNHRTKGFVLLLHDQTNTSAVWSQIGTMQMFSAFGYSCIAPDFPGIGKTGGAVIEQEDRANFIDSLLESLGVTELVVVGSSMAGQYIIPLLCSRRPERPFHLQCVIAIGLSDTNKLSADLLPDILTPCLVLRGSFDTSIGLNATNVLSMLPNSRIIVVPEGRHLCHISSPGFFHKAVLNFLDVVSKNVTKSIFVTEL